MNRLEKTLAVLIIITFVILLGASNSYSQETKNDNNSGGHVSFWNNKNLITSFGLNGNFNIITNSLFPTFEVRLFFLTGEFGISYVPFMNIISFQDGKDFSEYNYMFMSFGILPNVLSITLKPKKAPMLTIIGMNFNIGMKVIYTNFYYQNEDSETIENNYDVLSLKFPLELELLFLYICGFHASFSPAIAIVNNKIGFTYYIEMGFRIVFGG